MNKENKKQIPSKYNKKPTPHGHNKNSSKNKIHKKDNHKTASKKHLIDFSKKIFDLVNNKNRKIIALKVKPNAKKTRFSGYDSETDVFSIDVAAPPDKNKANITLIRFLSRTIKKKVHLSSGASSKNKLLKVID